MKLIHCADLHLDSKLTTHLSPERARERRRELLQTYLRMVEYALQEEVHAILIAGDLFDTRQISRTARQTVLDSIQQHPELLFFYVTGNHEQDGFLSSLSEIPPNLKLFGESWKRYQAGPIVIYGADLGVANRQHLLDTLQPDPEKINLVLLHGQVSAYASDHKAEIIDLSAFRNRAIDYLALGHLHTYRQESLPPRGRWCYPGCLEGRGFDECGEHGFVLLDIDTTARTIESTFIPFALRRIREIPVDVTGCQTSADAWQCIERTLAATDDPYQAAEYWKVVLTGEVDISANLDPDLLRQRLRERCYAVQVEEQTRLSVDAQLYAKDLSLKGEFVRLVQGEAGLSEQEKAEIMQCGIRALAGEEFTP